MVLASSCGNRAPNVFQVDTLITNGTVYTGADAESGASVDVGFTDDIISFIGDSKAANVTARKTIDATGLIVAPGFIDPHTHALGDLLSPDRSINANYLTQGVTTVFTGNDGGGPTNTGETLHALDQNNIGTNVALFVGHGAVRGSVVGSDARAPTQQELDEMRGLVRSAMEEGALGFSTGLYYAPGTFAALPELVALTSEVKPFGGVYESHLRDESSYTVGLLSAVDEALEIGRQTGVAIHIAHIKALGADVWGKSASVIEMVEEAQADGLKVTADQYPWRASGTRISNALIPNWAKDGGAEKLRARMNDPALEKRLEEDITENLRIRGGPESILITGSETPADVGKTFGTIAKERETDFVSLAKDIVREGDARIASFNMREEDITAFMRQPWVMTSSDGSEGHPRKYASFPRKYARYVVELGVIDLGTFIHRSTGLVADTFSICDRGYLREDQAADIVIFDPEKFKDLANFRSPKTLSTGVSYLFVNGEEAISEGEVTEISGGEALRRQECGLPRSLSE